MNLKIFFFAAVIIIGSVLGGLWIYTPQSATENVAELNSDAGINATDKRSSATQQALNSTRPDSTTNTITVGPPTPPLTTTANINTATSQEKPKRAAPYTTAPAASISKAKQLLYTQLDRKAVLDALSQRTTTNSDDQSVHLRALYDCAELFEKQRANTNALPSGAVENAERKEAFEKLNKRCDGIAKESVPWEYAQAELAKLERQGNLLAMAATLPNLIGVNRYDMIAERLDQIMNLRDPLVMEKVSDFVITQMDQPVFAQALKDSSIDLTLLRAAWATIECDAAGGCGAQSSQAAQMCAQSGVCGTGSVLDRYRQIYGDQPDFERYRELLDRSYRNGDWSWLPLQLVKNAPPKAG
jgi:hypothetical protein